MGQFYDCIVIGGGIAGLMAANKMTANGMNVLVLDKGRAVGGRMATRIAGNLRFDHGAQVISPKCSEFVSLIKDWRNSGLLQAVDYPETIKIRRPGTKHYSVKNGFTQLANFIAEGLNVKSNCKVMDLAYQKDRWTARSDDEEIFTAKSVIMTPPVPQSLDIIKQGGEKLPEEIVSKLMKIEYEPCIALLVKSVVADDVKTSVYTKPGFEPIALIVNNHLKGISPDPGAVTVHTTRKFSEEHWDEPDSDLIESILKGTKKYLRYENGYLKIHRWRYCRAAISHPNPFVIIDSPGLLAFAGDGFNGKDIEGAALSGLRAAEAIISMIG